MDKITEYAPWLIVAIIFFLQNKIFVRPEQMSEKFIRFETHLEQKFVLQKAYDIAIEKLEDGYNSINEKLDKIYDILIKG